MGRIWNAIEYIMESDVMQFLVGVAESRHSLDPKKICADTLFFLSPMLCFLFCFYFSDMVKNRREKYLKTKGRYFKELPIREAVIHLNKKDYVRNSISFNFKIKKKRERNAGNITIAKAENIKHKHKIFRGMVSLLIPSDEICLIARSASVYNRRNNGEIKAEEERNRSFRLDISYSWEKKKNEEWLGGENTVRNEAGEIIGVRGISEKTSELGYDIFIPKAEEEELLKMGSDELLKFCEPENCKLQVREGGSKISFSDIPGYTKADVIKAIKEAAEAQGIKVKIKK